MKLHDLLRNVDLVAVNGRKDLDVTAVVSDSRLATSGSLFVAVPGIQQDGAKFVESAIEKGAVAVVIEQRTTDNDQRTTDNDQRTTVTVADARAALARIAAHL